MEEENEDPEDLNLSRLSEFSFTTSGPLLYQGEEAKGFHTKAGSSYIYPTNFPVRQYQAAMVKSALFKNTLVSLPTGLGKTFIAAVVMYNFYRWYPCGKVVFMAPTRPLVAQQITACHYVMNIPVEDTVEMTGTLPVEQRVNLWKEKRVFFLTPQVMVNDLMSKSCPAHLLKCVVVDEAHRALKDYAYCQVVKLLDEAGVKYRMLALSATPGNDINSVQHVIRNLRISHLELRGEDAMDVAPYTHSRSVENFVIDLSVNIGRVKQDFLQIMEKYAKKPKEMKAFNFNISTVSKFQILKATEKFRANPPRNLPASLVGSAVSDLTVCMSLAHALDLLQVYGLRAFYNYLTEDKSDKSKGSATRIKNDEDLRKILERLKQILSTPPGKPGYTWGHPKYQKLVSILLQHFTDSKEQQLSTRAMIFCEYRVVVNEVVALLGSLGEEVRPAMFIGQSGGRDRGMPQAKQLEIMKSFRDGKINCLVATCVAEEGLDVGEVDLIVLVEAHKSITRLVQRIGRTGRKRKGRVVVLLTKGKEEYKFREVMATRKSYVSNILSSTTIRTSLYQDCPSMLPPNVKPERELVHIKPEALEEPAPKEKAETVKQVDIRSCLVKEGSPFISQDEFARCFEEIGRRKLNLNRIPGPLNLAGRNTRLDTDELLRNDVSQLSEWLDWNRTEQASFEVGHSKDTRILCDLLREGRPRILEPLGEEKSAEKAPRKKPLTKVKCMDIRKCIGGMSAPVLLNVEDQLCASLGFNLSDFESLLNSDKMVCPLSKEPKISATFEKYGLPFLDWKPSPIQLNVKDFALLLSTFSLEDVERLSFVKAREGGTLVLSGSDEFVGVDDLFDEGDKEVSTQGNDMAMEWGETPIRSTLNKSQFTASTPHQAKGNMEDDFDDGIWNLDDIFEEIDEEKLIQKPEPTATSTMLGITQFVSLIEKEKNDEVEVLKEQSPGKCDDVVNVDELFDFGSPPGSDIDVIDSSPERPTITPRKTDQKKFSKAKTSKIEESPKPPEDNWFEDLEFDSWTTPKKAKTSPDLTPTKPIEIPDSDSSRSPEPPKVPTKSVLEDSPFSLVNFKKFKNKKLQKTPEALPAPAVSFLEEKTPVKCSQRLQFTLKPKEADVFDFPSRPAHFLSQGSEVEDVFMEPEKEIGSSPLSVKTPESVKKHEVLERTPKVRRSLTSSLTASKSEQTPNTSSSFGTSPIVKPVKRRKIKSKNRFFENEADESGLLSSDDDDGSDLDQLDPSFIDDAKAKESTSIRAKYLQSIKSPQNTRGAFRIPSNINYELNVFSQMPEQDTHYENDSFCVDSDVEELVSGESDLEAAERLLEGGVIELSSDSQETQAQPVRKKLRKTRALSSSSEGENSAGAGPGKRKQWNLIDSDSDFEDNFAKRKRY